MKYPCHDAPDKDVFFVEMDPEVRNTPEGAVMTRSAVEICASCDVVEECALVALANASLRGVWGGTTEAQRRLARRRMEAGGTHYV